MKPAPFAALLAGGAAGVDASTTAREGKMREKGGKSGMAGVGGTRLGQLSDVIASGAKQSRAVYTTLDCFAPLAMTIQMRSEEHTSELQSPMRISYAVICLKKN